MTTQIHTLHRPGLARHAEVARIQEPDPAADTGLVDFGDSDRLANVSADCRALVLSPARAT